MAGRLQQWWYRNVWEPRSQIYGLTKGSVGVPSWSLDEILGVSPHSGGQNVNYNSAITLSAVWRAFAIKSGILASFPKKVYKRTSKGRIRLNPGDHPAARMLSRRLNPKMTNHVFFERSEQHLEGWGNHYGVITFSGLGTAEKIDLVHPKKVEVYESPSQLVYKVDGEVLESDRIIHVPNMGDGPIGKSTVAAAREDIGLQMDTRDYGTTTFSRGGIPIGMFLPKDKVQKVTDQQREDLIKAWESAKSRSKAVAIPQGWEWLKISMDPEDVAWIAANQFGITTVSRWTGVPPQKLADLGRATLNNVEHMGIEFLQDTMAPLSHKYESEYTTKIFRLPSEDDMYIEFDMDAYLRADTLSKAEALTKLIQFGLRTPNEARKLDNYEPKEGGDDLFMQSGTIQINMIKQLMLSKTPQQRQQMAKNIERQLTEGIDPQLIVESILNGNSNGAH